MKSVIKIRLYPTKRQKREIFKQFETHKQLYNLCLDQRKTAYEKDQTNISCYTQIVENVPKFKFGCNYSSLQQTVRRLDKTFQSFFRRCKNGEKPGYPRFKGRFNSIDFAYGDGCKIRGTKVYFQHIGEVKAIIHRNVVDPSRCVLSYVNGDFYVCFTVEAEIKTPAKTGKSVGLDFGLKTFITTSENTQIQNPKFHKLHLKRLKKLQSQRDKLDIESIKRRTKTKQIQKTWKRICNLRHDFNHKTTNKLIQTYDIICLEKIQVNELTTNIKNINRTYRDVCWNQFANILSYKAANAGRNLIFVNPAYTSKACSKCGKVHDLLLKDRIMDCDCGNNMDRNHNAALNILGLGLQSLANS